MVWRLGLCTLHFHFWGLGSVSDQGTNEDSASHTAQPKRKKKLLYTHISLFLMRAACINTCIYLRFLILEYTINKDSIAIHGDIAHSF